MRARLLLVLVLAPATAALAAAADPTAGPGGSAGCARPLPVAAEDLFLPAGALGPGAFACWGKVQPGALMTKPYGCTMSWVVADDLGDLYVATAGHCVDTGKPDQPVHVAGQHVGKVAAFRNEGVGRDWALVRIDPSAHHLVDPTLCFWGGPAKSPTYKQVHDVPWLGPQPQDPVLHYGWGANTNEHEETRRRAGYAIGTGASHLVLAGNYNPGDSGSPVMFTDGSPAGIVTHSALVDPPAIGDPDVLVVDRPPLGAGLGFATRFDAALADASATTGRQYALVTSAVPVLALPQAPREVPP